jgi:excisionase family DNA binding protein
MIVSRQLYSVEQVAEQLGLHVKTVRGYVRAGRLPAVRIGKQYRIAREDLEALTGRPAAGPPRETVRRHRHVEVSSVVEIDAISTEAASRVTNSILASVKGRSTAESPLRIETLYDEERARLKLIVIGPLRATATLFELIDVLQQG